MAFGTSLKEPSLAGATPVAPVQENIAASAITTIGNIGFAIDKRIRESELRTELETVNQIAAQQEAEAQSIMEGTTAEKNEAAKMQKDINKLKNAIEAGANEDSMKIRAEAILKKHSARAPGYSQEFRRIAGSVLGFDPTGAATQAAFDATEARQKQLAAIKKDYVKVTGSAVGWGTPQGTSAYVEMGNIKRQKMASDDLLGLVKNTNSLEAINARQEIPKQTEGMFVETQESVNAVYNKYLGKGLIDVVDADIQSMTSEQQQAMRVELESIKATNELAVQDKFGSFNNIEQVDMQLVTTPSIGYVDLALQRLDRTKSAEQTKATNDIYLNTLTSRLLADPQTRLGVLWNEVFQGFTAPPGMSVDLLRGANRIIGGKTAELFPTAYAETGKQSRLNSVNYHKSIIKSIANSGATDEQKQMATTYFKGLSDSALLSYNNMTLEERDALMSILQDPNLAKALDITEGADVSMGSLRLTAEDYATKTMQAMITSLSQVDRFVTGQASPTTTQQVIVDARDLVNFTPTSSGLRVAPKTMTQQSVHMANILQKNYVSRLNRSIKALANLDGTSTESAFNTVFKESSIQSLFKTD